MKNQPIKIAIIASALVCSLSMNAQLKILSNGNVGIASTTPSQKFDLNGNGIVSGAGNRMYFFSTDKYLGMPSSTINDLSLVSKDGNWLRIGSSAGIAFWGQSGAEVTTVTPTMFVNDYGLGIGGGFASSGIALNINGNGYASGTIWWSSDLRFKSNVKPIDNAMEKVLKLNGKTYEFKQGVANRKFSEGTNIGLIAQEVKQILPDAVMTDDEGYLAVNYIALIPVLIEAFKTEHAKVETLERKLNGLVNGVDDHDPLTLKNGLIQNVPNPFTDKTEIHYTIESGAKKAQVMIFDMQGSLVKTYENLASGEGKLIINGSELTSGMYIYSLIVDGQEMDMKRMILSK
ncbi:MAG: tail fiber domain-containing protein [Bacteroidota bacterium]